MKILNIKLENFQDIRDEYYEFNGMDVNVYGRNETGKSTIFNAVAWLLYGKAATDIKNYTPETLDGEGNPVHNQEAAVEALLMLDDGSELRLRKVYKEVWSTKSGTNESKLKGHAIEYYIDGVPTKEKEYVVRLMMDIATGDRMQALMCPTVFPFDWKWGTRRDVLLDVYGDVDDEAVYGENPELEELRHFLLVPGSASKSYSIKEYQKIAAEAIKKIKARLEKLPGLINEAKRAAPDMTGADEKGVKARIAELQGQKRELETGLAALRDDGGAADLRKKLTVAQIDLEEERLKWSRAKTEAEDKFDEELRGLRDGLRAADSKVKAAESSQDRLVEDLKTIREKRLKYGQQYDAIVAQQWNGNTTCPTCGQTIPEEQIETAQSEFRLSKSNDLENIKKRVSETCSKDMIAEAEAKIAEAEKRLIEAQTAHDELSGQFKAKEAERPEFPRFTDTDGYKIIDAKIAQIKADMLTPSTAAGEKTAAIEDEITAINKNIAACQDILSDIAQAQRQQTRVNELSAEEKTLAAERERLEHGEYLCDMFIRTKVSMLDERINSNFENVRFKMLQQQVNGGISEICEVLIPNKNGRLVPFNGSSNKAGKVNAGLELIEFLSRHWGVKMPVFIDDAEGVCFPRKIDTQVIRLIVRVEDEKLRVELVPKDAA